MYSDESEVVKRSFIAYATKNYAERQHYHIVDMNSLGVVDDDKNIRKHLIKPMAEVSRFRKKILMLNDEPALPSWPSFVRSEDLVSNHFLIMGAIWLFK
jgi:hypothetical protein